MRHIWSPWRRKYIEGSGPVKGCIFCDAHKRKDEEMLVVHRNGGVLVMLNRYPYTGGHLMVAPRQHMGTIEKLPDETLLEILVAARRAMAALRAVYAPPAFNLGINIGEAAGAGVADHVHLHIVPRWPGDTNFMTVLSDTRVLPEALEDTWNRLREAFGKTS
jgi:ATP adenylyltransferase